jgi:hypothetical protein
MQLLIRTLQGRTTTVAAEACDTVAELKRKLQASGRSGVAARFPTAAVVAALGCCGRCGA